LVRNPTAFSNVHPSAISSLRSFVAVSDGFFPLSFVSALEPALTKLFAPLLLLQFITNLLEREVEIVPATSLASSFSSCLCS